MIGGGQEGRVDQADPGRGIAAAAAAAIAARGRASGMAWAGGERRKTQQKVQPQRAQEQRLEQEMTTKLVGRQKKHFESDM